MRKLSSLTGFLIGAFLVTPPCGYAATTDDPATHRLIEQALHWQKKGRDDLAVGIWQKLLLVDPGNQEALIELGNIETRAGRTASAEDLLKRAKALPNPPKRLGELESALAVSRAKPGELEAARKEAQAGNSEQAISRYQSILGPNVKPDGQFGLEYYQTLGGTKGGWEEARRGLENLAQKNPGDDRYLLALARHLTYRDSTRREGIRQLADLINRSSTPGDIQKAWRQALAWLGSSPSDMAMYAAYLKRFPDDVALSERMRQTERTRVVYRPGPEQIARQAGFRLLNAGEIAEAEKKFTQLLQKTPDDADSLGGLGIVRLRQERFAESLQLIERAIRVGGKSSRWESARRSAQYWASLQPIMLAQANGSLRDQEQAIRQAMRLEASDPTAELLLADLYLEQKNWEGAEGVYRNVLKKNPQHQNALRGLMVLMVDTGRSQEALAYLENLDPQKFEDTGGLSQVKAATMVKIAEADELAGWPEIALDRLEDALLIDPSSAGTRLALVRIYQKLGDNGAANALLEDLQEHHADLPAVQQMRASLLAEQGRWWEALRALENIPPSRRSTAMVREQKRFWINVQVERARQFYGSGQSREAQSVLTHAEQAAGNDADFQGIVATAWADTGQAPKGLRMLRTASSKGSTSVGSRLQYAGMLLNMRLDAELLPVLRELSESDNLSAREQSELNNLIVAYTLRKTDSLRESGRITEAYDVLIPVLQKSTDTRLQMALARIYNSAREPENALRISEEVILREPDLLEHRLFASGVALGARAYDRANIHAEAALALAPDHPRALTAAGRVEKARGNVGRAMEYFQYAQALEKDNRAFAGAPGNLSLRLVDPQAIGDTHEDVRPKKQIKPSAPVRQNNILPLPSSPRGSRSAIVASPTLLSDYDEPAVRQGHVSLPDSQYAPSLSQERSLSSAVPSTTGKRSLNDWPFAGNVAYPGADAGYVLQPARQDISSQPDIRSPNHYAATEQAETLPKFMLASQPKTGERTALDEINDISLLSSKVITGGLGFRTRSGETGMSQLTSIESTLEARFPLDLDTGVTLRLTPVMLDAGKLDLAKSDVVTRFGSAGLGAFVATPFAARTESDSGLALSLAIDSQKVSADIGTTPLGFSIHNLVGGAALRGEFEGMSLKIGLNRRPVIDSLLSYAGTVDPLTGKVWGGVVKNGGNFDVTIGDDLGGVYLALGASSLTGDKVKDNRLLEGTLGAYWRAYQSTDTQVTLGLNMTAMSYQYNLSHFTLGHGGYFSPQRYLAFGTPFDLAGRQGRFAYQVGGDFGIRSIKQDETPYYPADGTLQSLWENRNTPAPGGGGLNYQTTYAAEDSNGLGYKLFAKAEYSITDKLAIGGRILSDHSRNYAQQQGLIYLRHAFDGLAKPVVYPPQTLRMFSPGEPL